MPIQLAIRVASLLATAAAWLALEGRGSAFQWMTYSMGFAHYTLAMRYSTRQLAQATSTPAHGLALLGMAFLAASLYLGNASLVIYFGIHHACNEAFSKSPEGARPGPGAAFFLQAAAYAFVLRREGSFIGVDTAVFAPVFALAIALYAVSVARAVGFASPTRTANACGPEIAALLLAAASLFVRVEFLQVVLYHFVLWTVLPLGAMRARGRSALTKYVAASVLVVAGFALISPIGPDATQISALRFTQLFLLLSYAHITLSFALSDAHPEWLIRDLPRGPDRPGSRSQRRRTSAKTGEYGARPSEAATRSPARSAAKPGRRDGRHRLQRFEWKAASEEPLAGVDLDTRPAIRTASARHHQRQLGRSPVAGVGCDPGQRDTPARTRGDRTQPADPEDTKLVTVVDFFAQVGRHAVERRTAAAALGEPLRRSAKLVDDSRPKGTLGEGAQTLLVGTGLQSSADRGGLLAEVGIEGNDEGERRELVVTDQWKVDVVGEGALGAVADRERQRVRRTWRRRRRRRS